MSRDAAWRIARPALRVVTAVFLLGSLLLLVALVGEGVAGARQLDDPATVDSRGAGISSPLPWAALESLPAQEQARATLALTAGPAGPSATAAARPPADTPSSPGSGDPGAGRSTLPHVTDAAGRPGQRLQLAQAPRRGGQPGEPVGPERMERQFAGDDNLYWQNKIYEADPAGERWRSQPLGVSQPGGEQPSQLPSYHADPQSVERVRQEIGLRIERGRTHVIELTGPQVESRKRMEARFNELEGLRWQLSAEREQLLKNPGQDRERLAEVDRRLQEAEDATNRLPLINDLWGGGLTMPPRPGPDPDQIDPSLQERALALRALATELQERYERNQRRPVGDPNDDESIAIWEEAKQLQRLQVELQIDNYFHGESLRNPDLPRSVEPSPDPQPYSPAPPVQPAPAVQPPADGQAPSPSGLPGAQEPLASADEYGDLATTTPDAPGTIYAGGSFDHTFDSDSDASGFGDNAFLTDAAV